MNEKNANVKKEINIKSTNDILLLVEKKIDFFKDVIQKTIIHVQKNKNLNILPMNDVSTCIERLGELSDKIEKLNIVNKINQDVLINDLQLINNELSGLLKTYGTNSLEDLILICFGNNNKIVTNDNENDKLELLKKYFHPTSYKIVSKKDDKTSQKASSTEQHDYSTQNLTCYDICGSYKQFHMKVYGLKLFIRSDVLKKSLIIFGTVDDVVINYLNSKYIKNKTASLIQNLPKEEEFLLEHFEKFISSLTLKDYLIFDINIDFYNKFVGHISQCNVIKQKPLSQVVKEFILDDMYGKRNTIINLLIKSTNYENQYLAYLLYDLLTNETNGTVDTHDQIMLFDSFPWTIQQYFKQAMKKTVQYTNELSNFDINKIPLEQQICLMKTSDAVKEKAMMKLKEVKAKTEDSGSKARQYLDGLLKIPFSVYKRESILNIMEDVRNHFKDIYKKYNIEKNISEIPNKDKYTSFETLKYMKIIKLKLDSFHKNETMEKLQTYLISGDKKKLNNNIKLLNDTLNKYSLHEHLIKCNSLNKEQIKKSIENILILFKKDENNKMLTELIHVLENITLHSNNTKIIGDLELIDNNMNKITSYITDVKGILDSAVYGHDKAKKQIERIIGQWINGQQDGYCFGFEGPPGTGKTSLAKKGLSDCLKDEDGVSRPFAMIQMGGDSNGSTLHGHNYTYVGSTWGSIVQILIDKKCMNPIIFIDEVDKISRTEHGREIVGILTHLLDPTQNDCFQDKYFTGIDLDLSKALFILSYNDVDAIDKILLDRVHRIKFNSLTMEDKLIICKKHILPEVYKKMGLEDVIHFNEEVLKFVIEEYTLESGVRKLKEILFEIVGEINIDVLKNKEFDYELPIEITIDDVKNKYFKDKREMIIRKVPETSLVGFANGMYATSLGNGGTLPIHAKFFPSEHFLELKLTGLQQDVMRESMHVSLTVAWNLTPEDRKKQIRALYDGENNKCGINIHPGDGSVQKDGPSAGGIITAVLYSLLNNIPIKAKMAMTGEIQMSGDITAIGGLNYKIIGSIKAGVKQFIYPKENKKDFDEFYEKYKNDKIINDITFYEVNHISEALELLLEK